MVETHVIVEFEHALQTPHPPVVTGLAQHIPAERGIAPDLTVLGKVIRRATGNASGRTILLQRKYLALGPHVTGVGAHVRGHVAHDLDAALVGIGMQLVPLLLEDVLRTPMRLGLGHQAALFDELRPVGTKVLGPHPPRHVIAHGLLDGAECHIRLEPLSVLFAELVIGGIVVEVFDQLVEVGLEALHEVGIAGKCRETRIRRTELICGVDRQHLPVGLVACRKHVDELLGRLTHRARLAIVGHAGDVADHAHTALHRTLQALVLVEVQNGSPQRPQMHVAALTTVAYLWLLALHDVVHVGGIHGYVDRVLMLETRVGQHQDRDAIEGTRKAKHVVVRGEGPEVAIGKQIGKRLAHRDGVAVDRAAVLVLMSPRVRPTVVRIGVALHASFVAVVDAWYARHRHLQEGRNPQTTHGETVLALIEAEVATLLVREGLLGRCVAQHGEHALAIVTSQQVEAAHKRLTRVVLVELLQAVGNLAGRGLVREEVEHGGAEGIVHHTVKLGSLQVAAKLAIAHLVGRVLPHFADDERVGLLG